MKTARFVRWHHSLPTFGSETALSARVLAPSFAGSPRCALKADFTALPSSLLALLVFCSARSIDHGGDLYPASSLSSMCLLFFDDRDQLLLSVHHVRKKFQLLLAIFHPLCGFMHVLRPSVFLILELPRRSSQRSDSARILTYPPFGISRSKNQFMPISACTSRSGRSRGSSTASSLEGASHCIRCFTRARPFLLDAFPPFR